jgi:hypothetical protein
MAKETKAQRLARFAAERLEVAKATYTERMMAVLQRAVNQNFELEVCDGKFRVQDRDDRRFSGTFYIPPAWDTMSDVDLFSLEVSVELKEEASAELVRKAQARGKALAKLTEEEKELLGL